METRIYYVPRNQIGRTIMCTIVDRVGCSVGDFKLNRDSNTIRFVVTCNKKDIPTIERILRLYGVI